MCKMCEAIKDGQINDIIDHIQSKQVSGAAVFDAGLSGDELVKDLESKGWYLEETVSLHGKRIRTMRYKGNNESQ